MSSTDMTPEVNTHATHQKDDTMVTEATSERKAMPQQYNNMITQTSTTSKTYGNIHPEQAVAQLKLLGYKPGDTVYLRFIDPRRLSQEEKYKLRRFPMQAQLDIIEVANDGSWVIQYTPWTKWEKTSATRADGNPKSVLVADTAASTMNWSEAIARKNREGYGVYFSINKGGTKAEDITHLTAAFFETDDASKEEQWKKIESFSLAPTMVISTRKSLHTYYALRDNSITVDHWTRKIQRPLIMKMESDPAIDDPSRIMRLAGFYHAKFVDGQFEFVLCEMLNLDYEVGKEPTYTVEEVEAAVGSDKYDDALYTLWKRLQGTAIMHVSQIASDLGFDYAQAREAVKSMTPDEYTLYARRYNKFHKLCLQKAKGADVNPMDAWSETAKTLPKASLRKTKSQPSKIYKENELGEADTLIWAQYMPFYDPNGRPGWVTCQCPSVAEDQRHLHSTDSLHINVETGAIKSQRGADSKFVYEAMRENYQRHMDAEAAKVAKDSTDDWQKLQGCDRKPDVVLNQRYLSPDSIEFEKGKIYVIKSPKNTGKTVCAKTWVSQFTNVYSSYTRIAQAEEQCPRIGIQFKNKPSYKYHVPKVGFVINSIIHHDPSHLAQDGLFLLDEFNQIPDHIIGDTCNHQRQRIYYVFTNCIKAALADGVVILMSADIKNRDLDLVEDLAKELYAEVVYVENQYQVQKGDLTVIDSKSPYPVLDMIVENLQEGKKITVTMDTKSGTAGANAVAAYIHSKLPEKKVFTITGDNSGEAEVKNYLAHINTASLKTDCLITTPAMTNGVSIDNGHFDMVFGLYKGVLTVDDATQQMDRVRNCKQVYLWASTVGLGTSGYSLTAEQESAKVESNYSEHAELMSELMVERSYSTMTEQLNSPWFSHYCKSIAYRNQCMLMYRERIVEKMISDGFQNVTVVEMKEESKQTRSDVKECSDLLEIAEAKAVSNAGIMESYVLDDLMLQETKTKEQCAGIAKTWLQRHYGDQLIEQATVEVGNEELTGYAAMHVLDKKYNFSSGWQRLRFLVEENGEELALAKDLYSEGYNSKYQEFSSGRSLQDVKYHTLALRLMKSMKLDRFLVRGEVFSSADLAGLFKEAKKQSAKVQSYIGLNPKQYKHASQFFTAIMATLGLKVKQKRRSQERTYFVTPESWEMFDLYRQHKSGDSQEAPSKVEKAVKDNGKHLTLVVRKEALTAA